MSRRKKTIHPTSQILTQERVMTKDEQQSPAKQQNNNSGLSFTKISNFLPVFVFTTILHHAVNETAKYLEDIKIISAQISKGINSQDAQSIIDYINLLISLKELVLKGVSWASVTVNIVYCELENENTPEEFIPDVAGYLSTMNKMLDSLLTSVPQEPVLGITLAPDQKQFSETKAMISKVESRLEEIRRENREAQEDWGLAEQNAYERMLEGSYQSVPVEDFLDWLSELKRGEDV